MESREDIAPYIHHFEQTLYISDSSETNPYPEQHGVIENFQNYSKVGIAISKNTFEKLKKDFRIFKFNLKNKNENRVKKQLFIDQKTMTQFEQIIQNNKLGTVQNGLNFLMDGLSLRMREAKEINRQSATTVQIQNEQLNLLKQLNDQNKERNKILIIQHNKKLENFSSFLSNYVTKDFQQQLNQILENILDQQAYTAIIESGEISSLLEKLAEKIKTKKEEATSIIEGQDLG
ncbi:MULTISPECIES: hypothetical protein [Acinetobacter]|uniref:hypothetical protein n=1 Tax=Acinetobacter TaxID=469 RepID=UPI0019003624|nr:hypothetical protein [Acinetobacter bereziniae]MBJ8554684.1 hypothetical protein [Acinetobacter bereziniae]